MTNSLRINITLTKETLNILKDLSKKTGLKMSTIAERGILLFHKESAERFL